MSMKTLETTVTGWVANDPEVRKAASGNVITTFRIIHTSRYRGNQGWVDGKTSVYKINAWGTLGENVQASIRQGNPVIVSGRLEIRTWEGKNGQRAEAVINADSIGFDLAHSRGLCYRPSKGECVFKNQVYMEAQGAVKSPVANYDGVELATAFVTADQLHKLSVYPLNAKVRAESPSSDKKSNLVEVPENVRQADFGGSRAEHESDGYPVVQLMASGDGYEDVLAAPGNDMSDDVLGSAPVDFLQEKARREELEEEDGLAASQ